MSGDLPPAQSGQRFGHPLSGGPRVRSSYFGGTAGARTSRFHRLQYRIKETGKKVIQFLATQRIEANDAAWFHSNNACLTQNPKMARGSRFTQIDLDIATVHIVVLGDRFYDLEAGWIT
jgi:hypothetical protein